MRTFLEVRGTRYNKEIKLSDKLSAEEAANEAADVIMNEYEKILLEKSVKIRFGYLEKEEREEITLIALKNAESEDGGEFPSFSQRRKAVKDNVLKYLSNEKSVVPCGFVDFRMRQMYHWAESIVQLSADMFFDKKEYEEFTYLLSMFVAEKQPIEECIHLVWKNADVKLFNKRGRDVTKKYEREFLEAAKEGNISSEDLAISALIAAAPSKLVMHKPPENSPLAQTVKKIFGERQCVCDGCAFCEKD